MSKTKRRRFGFFLFKIFVIKKIVIKNKIKKHLGNHVVPLPEIKTQTTALKFLTSNWYFFIATSTEKKSSQEIQGKEKWIGTSLYAPRKRERKRAREREASEISACYQKLLLSGSTNTKLLSVLCPLNSMSTLRFTAWSSGPQTRFMPSPSSGIFWGSWRRSRRAMGKCLLLMRSLRRTQPRKVNKDKTLAIFPVKKSF